MQALFFAFYVTTHVTDLSPSTLMGLKLAGYHIGNLAFSIDVTL